MQKERMLAGKLYTCITEEKQLADMRVRKNQFLDRFNGTAFEDFDTRRRLVEEIFEKTGRNCVVNKPFYCDYGCNISVGDNFYANYDCVILDVNKVEIGDNVFLAPRVCIYTAGHPTDSEVRNMQLEYGYGEDGGISLFGLYDGTMIVDTVYYPTRGFDPALGYTAYDGYYFYGYSFAS